MGSSTGSPPAPRRGKEPRAFLLQGYDEYGIGYSESRRLLNQAGRQIAPANQTIHPIVLDSQVIGWWRRRVERGGLVVEPVLATTLTAAQRRAVEASAADYAGFAGVPVRVTWP